MLELKNNIWFIHKPKTGGTSVKDFFLANGLVVKDYKRHTSNVKIEYFENVTNTNHKVPKVKQGKWVSITRNPIDWYESYFYFLVQKMIGGRKYPTHNSVLREAVQYGYSKNISFDYFVQYLYDKKYPAYTHAYNFYNKRCDYILRTETLATDLANFLLTEYNDTFDVEAKLKILNKTIYQSKKTEINSKLPDQVVTEDSKNMIRELDKSFFNES